MSDSRRRNFVVVVDFGDSGGADIVFPVSGPVYCGFCPGKRSDFADRCGFPRPAVVIESVPSFYASVTVALSLSPLHALRFVLDGAAGGDYSLLALGLATRRRRDIAMSVSLGHW